VKRGRNVPKPRAIMRAATAKWQCSGKDDDKCLCVRAEAQATRIGRRGKRGPVVLDMMRKTAARTGNDDREGKCVGGVVGSSKGLDAVSCSSGTGPTGSSYGDCDKRIRKMHYNCESCISGVFVQRLKQRYIHACGVLGRNVVKKQNAAAADDDDDKALN